MTLSASWWIVVTVPAAIGACTAGSHRSTNTAPPTASDAPVVLIWYQGHERAYRSPHLLRVSIRHGAHLRHLRGADLSRPLGSGSMQYFSGELPFTSGPFTLVISLVADASDTLATYRMVDRAPPNHRVDVSIQVGGRNPAARFRLLWDWKADNRSHPHAHGRVRLNVRYGLGC